MKYQDDDDGDLEAVRFDTSHKKSLTETKHVVQ